MIIGTRPEAMTMITPKSGREFFVRHYTLETAMRAQAPLIAIWGEENVILLTP